MPSCSMLKRFSLPQDCIYLIKGQGMAGRPWKGAKSKKKDAEGKAACPVVVLPLLLLQGDPGFVSRTAKDIHVAVHSLLGL